MYSNISALYDRPQPERPSGRSPQQLLPQSLSFIRPKSPILCVYKTFFHTCSTTASVSSARILKSLAGEETEVRPKTEVARNRKRSSCCEQLLTLIRKQTGLNDFPSHQNVQLQEDPTPRVGYDTPIPRPKSGYRYGTPIPKEGLLKMLVEKLGLDVHVCI